MRSSVASSSVEDLLFRIDCGSGDEARESQVELLRLLKDDNNKKLNEHRERDVIR